LTARVNFGFLICKCHINLNVLCVNYCCRAKIYRIFFRYDSGICQQVVLAQTFVTIGPTFWVCFWFITSKITLRWKASDYMQTYIHTTWAEIL